MISSKQEKTICYYGCHSMTMSPIVLLSVRVKKMNKESGGVPLFIRSVPPSYQGPKGEEDEPNL